MMKRQKVLNFNLYAGEGLWGPGIIQCKCSPFLTSESVIDYNQLVALALTEPHHRERINDQLISDLTNI